jgi:hypothetical protein
MINTQNKGHLYMRNKYKTGDPCPKSGIWLRIEDNEKIPINKDDPFPGYHVKTGKAGSGAATYRDEPKRAHFKFIM